jgi:hypothetical protein
VIASRLHSARRGQAARDLLKLFMTLTLTVVLVAACADDDDDDSTGAGESIVAPGAAPSPAAAKRLEGQMEVVILTIRDGEVVQETVTLAEGQPTVLRVTNEDDVSYRIEIPEFVTPADISPAGTTDIGFTTPNAAEVEGRLFPADDGDPVDTFRVVVQSAGGVQP